MTNRLICVYHDVIHLNFCVTCVPSPFLDGIDVPEEQQDLPTAARLPVREQQVVAGDAQGASARRVQRLQEHHVLYVGGLDVLRQLHHLLIGPTNLLDCRNWPQLQITSSAA